MTNEQLTEHIKKNGYFVSHIAKRLGISRQALHKKRSKVPMNFTPEEMDILKALLKINQ
jgi:DNA-binding NtrC family response regulator